MSYNFIGDFWVEVRDFTNGTLTGAMKFTTLNEALIMEAIEKKYGPGKYSLIIFPTVDITPTPSPSVANGGGIIYGNPTYGSASTLSNSNPDFWITSSPTFTINIEDSPKKCKCDLKTLMITGCKCRGI